MKLLTPRQEILIINNVVKAVGDINKLNNTGYKYIYLCSGFIAHYNRYGFMAYYGFEPAGFRRALICNSKMNRWENFKPGDRDYDYYMQKARIYQSILDKVM